MPNITQVLSNPNRFFEEKMEEEVSLRIPFLIVLVQAIIGGISGYLTFNAVMGNLPIPADSGPMMAVIGVFSLVIGAVVIIAFWPVYAIVFHLISAAFKGDGGFKRTLEFTGYGFIPSIFSGIIGLFIMISYVLPSLSRMQIPMENPELVQEYIGEIILSNPAMQASAILGIVFTLWSASIWIFGIRHARKLSVRDSFITVAILTGVLIAYSIYNAFFAMGA
ncbi:MAG: Yip1 family protein [Halobacteriota archaeon]|nr:Yip1 family protein [Halobacteriota archaeon]